MKHKASLATPTMQAWPSAVRRDACRRDLAKFFADRGPHLAAMIAYFALLSFVPLTFLSLSLLGLTGRADESSFLVREIKKTLPGTPIDRIVDLVHSGPGQRGHARDRRRSRAALGLALALQRARVGSQHRLRQPNRSFLRGKGLAVLLMVSSLVTLFVALLTGSLGVAALQEYAPGFVSNAATAYVLSIGVSLIGVFLFLVSCYYVLTNEDVTLREVIPGAILATILLEGTFQVLPLYQRYADLNPALRAFGAPADPARLALRDGERDRARRRVELVARAPDATAGQGRI